MTMTTVVSRRALAALSATAFAAALLGAGVARAQVIDYENSDREMNAAIAQARTSLPHFVDRYRAGRGERHAVKVAIPRPDSGNEHIWMSLTGIEGDVFVGRIANEPVYIDYEQGDVYRAPKAQISDWTYREGGLDHGSYTTRVMLKRLTPEQRQQLDLKLAPLP